MQDIDTLSKEELSALTAKLTEQYEGYKAQGLRLDMSRGKPASEQLDVAMGMLGTLSYTSNMNDTSGMDTRNYGALLGIPEARRFLAELLEVSPEMVIVGGSSSLNLMYDAVTRALLLGVYGGAKPWGAQGPIKFLCPAPGYDRHFAICELFGIEMISIDIREDGPDMGKIEELVSNDPSIKGVWCVPKYSNPGGVVYSDETVRRFANLKPAADDFRIMWDNAYIVHNLYPDSAPVLANIFTECEKAGTQDMVLEFCSTSKISFAGGGIAGMAASKNNIELTNKQLFYQTIGYDKVNQLRHVRFYKDKAGLITHMRKLAEMVRPKFETVLGIFEEELCGTGVADWTKPEGGYFISVNTLPGCAKRTVALCKAAGVTLTGAGATFPYGRDPEDKNIRIAPTYPSVEELALAARLFCLCVKIAACEAIGEGKANG